jgi:hypothetical protein
VLLPELKASLLRRGAAASRQFAPTEERGSDFGVGQAVAGEPDDLSRPGLSWAGIERQFCDPSEESGRSGQKRLGALGGRHTMVLLGGVEVVRGDGRSRGSDGQWPGSMPRI